MFVTDWMPTILVGALRRDVDMKDLDAVDHWHAMVHPNEELEPRTEALVHFSTWTSCCNTTSSGDETCSGFLSDCYDQTTATLGRLKSPRAAIVTSQGIKLILNEYTMGMGGNAEQDERAKRRR